MSHAPPTVPTTITRTSQLDVNMERKKVGGMERGGERKGEKEEQQSGERKERKGEREWRGLLMYGQQLVA